MKINDLYKIARRNWIVKLICLVLAIFIYFFYRATTLQDKDFSVPLEISSQGIMCAASTTPSHVKVFFKGREKDLSRISEQNVSAYLNLDYYKEAGTYDIPIQVVLKPEILGIDPLEVNVDKGWVTMTIEPKTRSQVHINPSIQGIPATGYEIIEILVEPSTVEVFGAQSLVDSMAIVSTEPVDVDRKRDSFTQTVDLSRDNKLVSYNESEVKVTVNIVPITITRDIKNQIIQLYGVNPELEAELNPKLVSLTLTGDKNMLEAFTPELQSVRVDCSGITEPGTYELPVEVDLPEGIRLVSQSSRVAKVSLFSSKEKSNEGETMEGDATKENASPAEELSTDEQTKDVQ